jgi:hypothetical protein
MVVVLGVAGFYLGAEKTRRKKTLENVVREAHSPFSCLVYVGPILKKSW